MLPQKTILGQLEIFEVYEYLDGPRLFAVKNNIGSIYLVYWFDEQEEETGWLYLPISEEKLNQLRRKEISLNEAYRHPETFYIIAYTKIPPQIDTAELVLPLAINKEFFPPDGYYIEYVDVVDEQNDWLFETILRGERRSTEIVAQFLQRFRELTEAIINVVAGTKPQNPDLQIYPLSALPGSLKIKFSADNNDATVEALKIISQIIQINNKEELRSYLNQHRIDSVQLREFLSSIARNTLDVEIMPKLAADGGAIDLPLDLVRQCIQHLNEISNIIIASISVPQADDIDKVIRAVEVIREGIPLIPENIQGLTTPRQVKYYTDAARSLGLISEDTKLTSAGEFLLASSDRERQYQVLADRFDSTDFGWAWLKWAGVGDMTELEPETAERFILDSVPALGPTTAHRRASTLRQWLQKLRVYHRKYKG